MKLHPLRSILMVTLLGCVALMWYAGRMWEVDASVGNRCLALWVLGVGSLGHGVVACWIWESLKK